MTLKNPYKRGGMFEGASYLIFERAKQLRNNMTDAENALWIHLKGGINGLKFRRQHPIGVYIADFYCYKARLIIEIDGSIHEDPIVKELDIQREKHLEDMGYTVIRFTNEGVMKEADIIIEELKITINNKLQSSNITPKIGV